MISESDFISLLSSLPTTFYISVFVYVPLSFNLDGKYSCLPFQTFGDNDLPFFKTSFYKGAADRVWQKLMDRTKVFMKMLRREILVLCMLNVDACDSRIGQHSWEEQRGKKETIVSTFTAFSDLFQSIVIFLEGKGNSSEALKRHHHVAVTMSSPFNSTLLSK